MAVVGLARSEAVADPIAKYQHAVAIGTLMLLAAFAFLGASITRFGERLSILGALIEVAQSLPLVHRDCDIYDWAADTIGTIIIAVLISAFTRQTLRGLSGVRRRATGTRVSMGAVRRDRSGGAVSEGDGGAGEGHRSIGRPTSSFRYSGAQPTTDCRNSFLNEAQTACSSRAW